MEKQIICLIGTSTSGKSSVVRMLLDKHIILNDIYVVKQTTCRNRRADDDNDIINIMPQEEFEKQEFVCKTGIYGTLKSDFAKFYNSNCNICIMTVGTSDLVQIRKFISDNNLCCKLNSICLRLTNNNDITEEQEALERNMRRFFKPEEIKQRKEVQFKLIRDYFCNTEFLSQNIDLVLDQKHIHYVDIF